MKTNNPSHMHWPPMGEISEAHVYALAFQLNQIQWWPANTIEQHQFEQLSELLPHALRTTTLYHQHANALRGQHATLLDAWRALPPFPLSALMNANKDLRAQPTPPAHGKVTFGEQGLAHNDVTRALDRAIVLRAFDWHGLDTACPITSLTFANIPGAQMLTIPPIGVIALKCPEHGKLHIQAERVLVEVVSLDPSRPDASDPPPTGSSPGRVLVSVLHNFATPVLRCDVGLIARIDTHRCACGRGLPILSLA